MELFEFYASARRLLRVIIATCLIGAAVGGYLEFRNPAGYVAHAQLFATNPRADNVSISQNESLTLVRMDSYVRLASTESVAKELIKAGATKQSPVAVAASIDASVNKGTTMMTVRVKSATREEATAISKALPEALTTVIGDLSPADVDPDRAPDVTKLTMVNGPDVSATRALFRFVQSIVLGLLMGLLAGAVIAAIHARFRRGIRSPDGLRDLAEASVLGIIPKDNAFDLRSSELGTRRRRWNAYQRMARNIRVVLPNVEPPLIAVTAPRGGAGITATATGLAAAVAATGQKVLLLDTTGGSFPELGERTPVQSKYHFPVQQINDRGPLFVSNLDIASQGSLSTAFTSNEFQLIVLDMPPLLTDYDTLPLVDHADAIVLVASQYRTLAADVIAASQSLQAMGAHRIATVLNRVEPESIPESQMLAGLALAIDEKTKREPSENTPSPADA